MAKRSKAQRRPIHPSIKRALGYPGTGSDDSVLADWEERKRRVCKPCWELKYCPYGPLIEQSPMIPPLRGGKVEHVRYLETCLNTGLVGESHPISEEKVREYRSWLDDEETLLWQAVIEFREKRDLEQAGRLESEADQVRAWIGNDLPPIHIYRAPFDWERGEPREAHHLSVFAMGC